MLHTRQNAEPKQSPPHLGAATNETGAGATEALGTAEIRNELPRISIIMPIRNEARSIERSLGGVLSQDYPRDRMEILIVDGRSDDETITAIREMMSKSGIFEAEGGRNQTGLNLRILDNPLRVVPAALNIGLQHAHGEVIFRLDGHSEMAPDYLRKCAVKLLERPDVACVAGPSVAIGSGWIGGAYALALRSPFGVGGSTFRTIRTEAYVDTLAFGCYRRTVFDEVGGFDPELNRNQDIEFSARLRKAGYRLLLISGTHTFYHAPRTTRSIIRQGFRNGYWNIKELRKMAGVLSWRHFIPGLFVICLVASVLLSLAMSWGRYLLFLVVGSYAILALLASAALAVQTRRSIALLLPAVFGTMHLSYGLGSLVGLFRYFTGAGSRFLSRAET